MTFLFGSHNVLNKVKSIIKGQNGTFIVAYIGSDITDYLSHSSKANIVCDVDKFTACDPREVDEILRGKVHRVKKFNNLHAKVFVSDIGAFVGSKNLTTAGSYEAGIFCDPLSDDYRVIKKWAEDFFRNKAHNIYRKDLDILIARREVSDLGKVFFRKGNSTDKHKKKKDRTIDQDTFEGIPNFGGIVFWKDEFDAKKGDISLKEGHEKKITLGKWYEKYGLDENGVFQDNYDPRYAGIIDQFLSKNFICIGVTKNEKKIIHNSIGIISPIAFESFQKKDNPDHMYIITGYRSKSVPKTLSLKKISGLISGIWQAKTSAFKKWQKTKAGQYWWMNSETLELCTKEYLKTLKA